MNETPEILSAAAPFHEPLAEIERLGDELMKQVAESMTLKKDFTSSDMFMLGAVRRTLAQSKGFSQLISARNFPCAAAILRMQIDTAMRVYALYCMTNRDSCCQALLGEQKFNTLKGADGQKMTDANLRKNLAKHYPWINSIYEATSDFIHLSGRHFYNSISNLDEETRTIHFSISGNDPDRPDTAYNEILGAFLAVSKLVNSLLLGYFLSRVDPKHEAENGAIPSA
jgi:hypothetical protein